MTLIFLSACWLIGVYVASQVQLDTRVVLLCGLVSLAGAILGRRDAKIRLLCVCLIMALLGIIRYQLALPGREQASIAQHIGPRPIEVGGIVTAEPDMRERDVRLTVSTYHVGNGRDSFSVKGSIQVYLPRYADYRYGDDLLLKGVLQDLPGDDTFSYRGYLLRQGIYAMMYYPHIEIVSRDQGNRLLALLYTVKHHLQRGLLPYLPEPQAGGGQGILLGVKAAMTDDLREDLKRTGLVHIVVVSGYNLTIIATLLQRLTEKRLPRHLALALALLGVIVFTLMTGASTPVVRAAIMVSMTILARAVGRQSDALTSLLFAAAVLVGLHPLALWDVSFQLSFLATLGLVVVSPPIERALARLPLGAGTILGTTLAAQIMTLPVILLNFNRISLISPVANLLVQPAIPPLMVLGTITAVAGISGHIAVRLVGWATWLLATYMVEIIHAFGGLPQAAVDIAPIPTESQPGLLVAYYSFIALLVFAATYVTRHDVDTMLQRLVGLRQRITTRVLIALLVVLVVVVWAVVLLALRQS